MSIRAIVPASTKAEALEKAETVFERLTENQHPFDYFTMFNHEGTSVSGKDRYEDMPYAVTITSPQGQRLLKGGMGANKREFLGFMVRLRKMMKASNEELFASADVAGSLDGKGWFRYVAFHLGQYAGSSIWLYDEHGSGIRNPEELAETLKYAREEGKNAWIVPADVHF
jgi:hypothetical protein